MPTAICEACQQTSTWRNQRGTRLADWKCPRCGAGPMVAAAYDPAQGKYIKRTAKPRAPQGPIVNCVLCGRRGRQRGPNFPRDRSWLRLTDYTRAVYGDKCEKLSADDPVCWMHFERLEAGINAR